MQATTCQLWLVEIFHSFRYSCLAQRQRPHRLCNHEWRTNSRTSRSRVDYNINGCKWCRWTPPTRDPGCRNDGILSGFIHLFSVHPQTWGRLHTLTNNLFRWVAAQPPSIAYILYRWWFQRFLLVHPEPGEMFQIDEHIFQMGWNHIDYLVHCWLGFVT